MPWVMFIGVRERIVTTKTQYPGSLCTEVGSDRDDLRQTIYALECAQDDHDIGMAEILNSMKEFWCIASCIIVAPRLAVPHEIYCISW